MNPTLLLVDLQRDFLAEPELEPAAGKLVEAATELLRRCRRLSIPVVHVWTTVDEDRAPMPHWRRAGRRACMRGTPGHETPAPLRPEREAVIEKRWFSAFSAPELEPQLRTLAANQLIVCGVHLHGCVRTTVLDAYQRGYEVSVAEDAVGGYDGLHAALTRRYLEGRAAHFESVDRLLEGLERVTAHPRGTAALVPSRLGPSITADLARPSRERPGAGRADLLARAADEIESVLEPLAAKIVGEIGKPIRYARAEVRRGVELLRIAARVADPVATAAGDARVRRVPLGKVAQITPFNNPLAVPLGKLAPALRYGNSVVWKPSPAALGVATAVVDVLRTAGCPPELVTLMPGGADSAAALMVDPAIDAVSLTGSSRAGFAAQAACATRRVPLQAELGGNNASIVWSDCDLGAAASAIVEAAFGCAGQRCTANRRVIVERTCYDDFVRQLELATGKLATGEPTDERVRVGPLVSPAARDRVAGAVERARGTGHPLRRPTTDHVPFADPADRDRYLTPTLVECGDPAAELVQEESFGPILVIQPAGSFDDALMLLNGVRQGLVASVFSASADRRARFLERAETGVLKLGRATADVSVEAPFGGWKTSGVGPPEHGDANREFYTRAQAVYS